MLVLLMACVDPQTDSVAPPSPVPWSRSRARVNETTADGRALRRAIVHLHSPTSHDACDDHETADEPCLADLRAGLCEAAVDLAFFTDHPASAAETPFSDLFWPQPGDEVVDGVASRIGCDDGSRTLWMAGIEDELMPVALDRHVSDDSAENDRVYNASDAEAIEEDTRAGALVLQAHTEGQPLETLLARQAWGQAGVEMFNLHAMVDPRKREDDLGLDAMSYLTDAGPFISATSNAEPDLVFLAFYEEQVVSIEKWDALNAVAPTLGTAGTDAHQNALPMLMGDAERVDSYRRMMTWFGNYLAVEDDSPAAAEAALRARAGFVAFDLLGTPLGFEVGYAGVPWAADDAEVGETFTIRCPTLAADSPTDTTAPTVTATVFRDGEPWQTGCGSYAVTEPGVYRVRVDIVPSHLTTFLGDQADVLVHAYPWVYSQAFRIGLQVD
jgi:hypothetical protein